MFAKKIFQIILIVLIIIVTGGVIYMSYRAKQPEKKPPVKAEEEMKPEYKPAGNQSEGEQWSEYTHADLRYRFRFPPDFRVERRGKVGNIEDLVALNYVSGGRQLTLVKFQLTNEVPAEKTVVSQSGKDNNGNEVLIYKIPFRDNQTLTLIGTVYPSIGSNYRFFEVIQKIAQTVTVL